MILTHGSNSIGRGNQNYILDNFVALYNGVTDSGYAINDGSFGQLLWDANGPIQSPNGQGTPYYARSNFSGNNGGVQAIYDELKSIFSSRNYTVDMWITCDVSLTLSNKYILGIYNTSRDRELLALQRQSTGNNYEFYFYAGSYIGGHTAITDVWSHIAFVCDDSNFKVYYNGQVAATSISNTFYDINTIRFRFENFTGGVRIAQFALRDYAVWTSDFTPPTLLYKQI